LQSDVAEDYVSGAGRGEPRIDPAGYVENEFASYREPRGNPPTELFVSPHLDHVAFSCGGTMAAFAQRGWYTVLATVFTRSVDEPMIFALECQLDKGLTADVDYMALRREEDLLFAERVGVGRVVWLDLPEAPHRGYASALFSGVLEGDEVWREAAKPLAGRLQALAPDVIFVPQALGNHADYLQVVRAVRELDGLNPRVVWYRDAPYAARKPGAQPLPLLPDGLKNTTTDISGTLEVKLHACGAYATQLGFQFGGELSMRELLANFAANEARRLGSSSPAAETFLLTPEPEAARLNFPQA
jgi:LmbE family N-acetylglucosaminyl deacetylase